MTVNRDDFQGYHNPRNSRSIPPEQRDFIAWDGEGVNLNGNGRPQSYILFGCSVSDIPPLVSVEHLHTFDILDYVIGVGEKHPNAFHVGFAFGYDANMICRTLSERTLRLLHENGKVTLRRGDKGTYHIQYLPKKWFSITKYKEGWDRKTNPHAKTTVKIYDLFGFFAQSFIKAYETYVGPASEVVIQGKNARNSFDTMDMDYIERYWRVEIQMLRELAEELRRRLYGAGLRITQWHGPGALASFAMQQHAVDKAKAVCPKEVRKAAKHAYAGGRFEIFQLGRIVGDIYSLDINSAYPYGISQLPNLTTGTWSHVESPTRLAKFGVYRVRLLPRPNDTFNERRPGPLFHRDKLGNISFPWLLEGWYWSPEVRNLARIDPARYQIIEGWEYTGWTKTVPVTSVYQDANVENAKLAGVGNGGHTTMPATLPFQWVVEMYQQRREWKEKGYGGQLALKLCMNSLYGKMAQRVGWNEETRQPPKWHQLEWAGWVTSLCRAMLWQLMSRIPTEKIIAVETDGLYTTMSPELLGIRNSKELGGWEVTKYDEILYVQSGMAHLRAGTEWTVKRRGLDARTFERTDCEDYLKQLAPNEQWVSYSGETTRFIGLGAALAGKAPLKVKHCVWQTATREIRPGQDGKRVHLYKQCKACKDGYTAWEAPHDMSIRSLAYAPGASFSKPHDIPWDGDVEAAWRKRERMMFDGQRTQSRSISRVSPRGGIQNSDTKTRRNSLLP